MNSPCDDTALPVTGFPIRTSPDRRLLSTSPKLIAASHVLHRLLAPRHPPCALNSLVTSSWVSYLATRAEARIENALSNSLCSCQRSCIPGEMPAAHAVLAAGSAASGCEHGTGSRRVCGADRDRTDDLRLAKPALSQLSYSPSRVVGLGRFELPTSRLSGVRSNHLSYRPGRALG